MPQLRRDSIIPRSRIATDQAEAALLEEYTGLVRLAYLTLPAAFTRHRRVLLAHTAVQRSLPGRRASFVPGPRVPDGAADTATDALRVRILRAALSVGHRPTGWPGALPPPRTLLPRLPVVWGLRLFPRAGGAQEVALVRALAGASAAARAAFVLRHIDSMGADRATALLAAAGVADAGSAVRESVGLDAEAGPAAAALLRSQEFDACSVQTRPTDLLRRARRTRAALAVGAVAVVAAAALLTPDSAPRRETTGGGDPVRASSVAGDLTRAGRDSWADTSRVDFTAWPARGDRSGDTSLLDRALDAWAEPSGAVRVSRTPDTPADAPPRAPQLLFAGDVDGRTVVLLSDGERLARYTAPDGDGPAGLALARVDDADVTTAAAVVLTRDHGSARYLTAPWITEAATRDLLRPDTPGRPLEVSHDGVTDPVPVAPADGCARRPVLQLRSSPRIVENHSFLLADLGGLSPVHLTYTPPPGHGTPPPRQPREATGSQALVAWARTACRLQPWRGGAVRAVNAWDFAEQRLPKDAGRAVWSCVRASTWRGPGDVALLLRAPAAAAEPAHLVGRARATAACSRFGQHVVADTRWKSPDGHWYLLAAGSRAVTRIEASGAVTASHKGRTLAVRAPEHGTVRVAARLDTGERLKEVPPERP
ncbi:hypothetical protein [Streptomyces endophyticus]|uniref:DNA-directed RNA polymerase specialized sigma24 family protein n=1 Tax=Streptomyces endophyticus TaxID=714166 RepID=A0ABU6F6Y3_9ACTN|nr:hypothetical protein [Streptomyces endophyticus]MEB8339120.1 hypothetical protein [Streptomyces endophyticus]